MTIDELKNILRTLSNSLIGSFGEYIISKSLDYPIKKVHKNHTDFIINGIPIDVKTIRNLNIIPNKQKNVKGINLAFVLILDTHVELYIKKLSLIKVVEWYEVLMYYAEWKLNHNIFVKRASIDLSEYKKNLNKIRENIITVNNENIRFIYRTTQKLFNRESSDNFIPKTIKENHITIFIDYKDCSFTESCINKIYAFYDSDAVTFPKLIKTRLHKDKIDLSSKVLQSYCYNSIDDLIERFYSN